MAWQDSKNTRNFAISIRYTDDSGSLKNVTNTISATVDLASGGKSSGYYMLWDITEPDTTGEGRGGSPLGTPSEEQAAEIATKIAKIYGVTAVPTQMSFGGYTRQRQDGK